MTAVLKHNNNEQHIKHFWRNLVTCKHFVANVKQMNVSYGKVFSSSGSLRLVWVQFHEENLRQVLSSFDLVQLEKPMLTHVKV